MKFKIFRLYLGIILLTAISMDNAIAQNLDEMLTDIKKLNEAYRIYKAEHYIYYMEGNSKFRQDYRQGGQWNLDELKKAIKFFEENNLKHGKIPLATFKEKYGDDKKLTEKFEQILQARIDEASAKTDNRFEKMKIKEDISREYAMPMIDYFRYTRSIDEYYSFKEKLANDVYEEISKTEEKRGKYNGEVIDEAIKEQLQYVLWLNPDHAEAKRRLNTK